MCLVPLQDVPQDHTESRILRLDREEERQQRTDTTHGT